MPYGNKGLHFGHVGGVFVQADVFARFLRDRIGPENVLFVSGTDCYGSPIVEAYRQATEAGTCTGSLEEFVRANHERQLQTLQAYHIEPDLFAASGLGRWAELHEQLGDWILRELHRHGHLKRRTTSQFYDEERGSFLNGRQVQGRCPIQGCRSEQAYADECSLGHQYEPAELIAPRSTLSGQTPVMRGVTNWYLDLPRMRDAVAAWAGRLEAAGWRQGVVSSIREYLEPPIIHVTRDQEEALAAVRPELPPHRLEEGTGKSVQLVFDDLGAREQARELLSARGMRYRTSKTLVPFRLTGNLAWGLPAPELDGLGGLTFWVWPESLWAPISFTAAALEARGQDPAAWREWWCRTDAQVYQFIGEDNVYFYGPPQTAMFLGTQGPDPVVPPPDGQLQMSILIANRHLLFLSKKASSSGKVKPPMADELLDHYTADQLRTHFVSLGLGHHSVSFRPRPLDPKPGGADPVLKEGNLLSNALNRAVRSCFYTAQKYFESRLPEGEVAGDVRARAEQAALDYEAAMAAHEFPKAVTVAGDLIREINQRWSKVNPYREDCDPEARRQALVDALHMVRVAIVLMHPIAPAGSEMVREYLGVGEELWRWDRIHDPLPDLVEDPATHRLRFLEPKVDFFPEHPSQLAGR
jgi:methionyl-tRNA synthetase